MQQILVAISDYVLTVECLCLGTLLLGGKSRQPIRVSFFILLGIAALCGGLAHQYYPDDVGMEFEILWRLTLLAIGGAGVCGWIIGINLFIPFPWQDRIARVMLGLFFFFAAYVVVMRPDYWVAMIFYLPPMLFLLIGFIYQWWQKNKKTARPAVCGISLTFVAAILQQAEIAIHPVFFDHNVFYHLLTGIALWLIYLTFRRYEN